DLSILISAFAARRWRKGYGEGSMATPPAFHSALNASAVAKLLPAPPFSPLRQAPITRGAGGPRSPAWDRGNGAAIRASASCVPQLCATFPARDEQSAGRVRLLAPQIRKPPRHAR